MQLETLAYVLMQGRTRRMLEKHFPQTNAMNARSMRQMQGMQPTQALQQLKHKEVASVLALHALDRNQASVVRIREHDY